MSEEREEVRWKFQVLSDAMNSEIQINENQRIEWKENVLRSTMELKEIRNNWLSGIGGGIGIMISLISLGSLGKEYTWWVIIGIIGAICIFVGYNIYMSKYFVKHYTIVAKYEELNIDLMNLKGLINDVSLREDVPKEFVLLITNFVFILGHALQYELSYQILKVVPTMKVNQEDFRSFYKLAKERMFDYRKLPFDEHVKRVEQFVTNFEKNEKQSTQH